MKKILEKNVAEVLVIIIFAMMLMSSCGVSSPYHSCGITPLNKQYKIQCKSRR